MRVGAPIGGMAPIGDMVMKKTSFDTMKIDFDLLTHKCVALIGYIGEKEIKREIN